MQAVGAVRLPLYDCPQFEDPLAERPDAFAGICLAGGPTVVDTSKTLVPGTSCGLTIENGSEVTFDPGVIRDNSLIVRGSAQVTVKGVGF